MKKATIIYLNYIQGKTIHYLSVQILSDHREFCQRKKEVFTYVADAINGWS